jgi:DNA-binding response OmpR family regulator
MPATVLLIDDDEDVVRIMGELLAHAGYAMLHAASLRDAKRLLEEARPAVVVLEPHGFGRSRWTEVASLAGGKARQAVPFVALTTLAAEREMAHSAGCARFLAKPASPREVLRTIATLIPQQGGPPADTAPSPDPG